MKYLATTILLAVLAFSAFAAESAPPEKGLSHVDLSVGVFVGGLFSGKQKDLPDQTLSPKPENYYSLGLRGGISIFPFDYFGIDATASFLGYTYGTSSKATPQTIALYDWSELSFGPHLRIPVADSSLSRFTLDLTGGVTYTFLKYDSDFTSLFSNAKYTFTFYDLTPQAGWYASLGGHIYFKHAPVFLTFAAELNKQSALVSVSGAKMDGLLLIFPLSVGLYL